MAATMCPCDRCGKEAVFYAANFPDGTHRHLECFTLEESYRDNGGWLERPMLGPKTPPVLPCKCGDCEECMARDCGEDDED